MLIGILICLLTIFLVIKKLKEHDVENYCYTKHRKTSKAIKVTIESKPKKSVSIEDIALDNEVNKTFEIGEINL